MDDVKVEELREKITQVVLSAMHEAWRTEEWGVLNKEPRAYRATKYVDQIFAALQSPPPSAGGRER